MSGLRILICVVLCFAVFGCETPVCAQSVPSTEDVSENFQTQGMMRYFHPQYLFRKLPEVANWMYKISVAVAFPIFVFGVLLSVGRHNTDLMRDIMRPALALGIIVLLPVLFGYAQSAVTAIAEALPGENPATIKMFMSNASMLVSKANSQSDDSYASESVEDGEDGEAEDLPFYKRWASGAKELWDGVTDFGPSQIYLILQDFVRECVRKLVWVIMSVILQIFLLISSLILVFYDLARYFLMLMGYGMMPVAIGALLVDTLRPQARTFILEIVGVICWPIGYAAVSIGTLALLDLTANVYASVFSIIPLYGTGAGEAIGSSFSELLMGEDLATKLVGFTVGVREGVAITIGSLFLLLIAPVFTCIWVVLGTLSVPFLTHKLISTGGNPFGSLMSGTAKTTGAVVAEGAHMATAMAATGGYSNLMGLGGGGGSGGGSGGGAGGPSAGGGGSGGGGGGGAMAGMLVGGPAGAAAGAAADMAGSVAGKAASAAGGSGGGGGSSGGGGGLSPAKMAGIQAMMGAAISARKLAQSFNGDPNSAAGAVDSGFDEAQRYRGIANMAAQNSRNGSPAAGE